MTDEECVTSSMQGCSRFFALRVVNRYGRVHGLDGLRIADAAIFPECPRANTHVVTMMLGERLADLLR